MTKRLTKRHEIFAAVFTVAALTTGLWTSFAGAGQAQMVMPTSPGSPGLTAVGTGMTTVPADSAIVVLNYYLTYIPSGEPNELPPPPPQVKPADYQPIVTALNGAGVSGLETTVDLMNPGMVRFKFTMDQPSTQRITQIVEAANQVALKDNKFSTAGVSVGLTVSDCTAAEGRARQLALADLRRRAEGLATTAGVQLGNLVSIADTTSWGNYYTPTCPSTANSNNPFPDVYSMPPFDPSIGTNVRITNQIVATYDMKRR